MTFPTDCSFNLCFLLWLFQLTITGSQNNELSMIHHSDESQTLKMYRKNVEHYNLLLLLTKIKAYHYHSNMNYKCLSMSYLSLFFIFNVNIRSGFPVSKILCTIVIIIAPQPSPPSYQDSSEDLLKNYVSLWLMKNIHNLTKYLLDISIIRLLRQRYWNVK